MSRIRHLNCKRVVFGSLYFSKVFHCSVIVIRFNRHGVRFQRIQFLIIKTRNHLPIILLEATFRYYLSALALLRTTLILEQENEK